jgi:uncharacterized protein with GYD domain
MVTFAMLTRIAPGAVGSPADYERLGRQVEEAVRAGCPEAHWIGSYAVLGPYDYLDLFEATDVRMASRVAVIVRSFGHARTETWPVVPYEEFLASNRTPA